MQNSHLGTLIAQKMVLFLCGTIVFGIAVAILAAPDLQEFSYAIAFGRDRQMTSALRSTAVALMFAAVVILAGAFRMRWAGIATATSAAVFLGLGVSQSLALVLGGVNEEEILAGAVAEFAIGAISLINLNYYRKQFQL